MMRSLTPPQAAALVAIVGAVLAVSIPAFLRNLRASHFVEPMEGLQRIAGRATLLAAGRSAETAYPASVGLTPAEVPRGERVSDPPDTWEHPTWRRLDFEISVPHAYSFSFASQNARPKELPLSVDETLLEASADPDGPEAPEVAPRPESPVAAPLPAADAESAALGPPEMGVARFVARAHGDLDGDGNLSTFEIRGESRDGSEPMFHPMIMHREVE